jgi:hypothetical protein
MERKMRPEQREEAAAAWFLLLMRWHRVVSEGKRREREVHS